MTDQHPTVAGYCPACGGESLFLGSGGFVTCSRLDCADPGAAADLLERGKRRAGSGPVLNITIDPPPPRPQLIPVLARRCPRCGYGS